MNFTRLLAVARKEVMQILRDSRSLIIVVIMPVTLMLLFGYGVNLDLKGLPIYVYDQDGSQQSQDLLKRFQSSEYFHVARVVEQLSHDYEGSGRRPRKDGDRDSVGFFSATERAAVRFRFRRLWTQPTTTRPMCLSAMRRRLFRAIRRRFSSIGFAARPADSTSCGERGYAHLVQRRS